MYPVHNMAYDVTLEFLGLIWENPKDRIEQRTPSIIQYQSR